MTESPHTSNCQQSPNKQPVWPRYQHKLGIGRYINSGINKESLQSLVMPKMPERNRYIDSVDRAQRRARGYTDLGATLGVGSFIYLFSVVLFFIFECIFYSYGSYNEEEEVQNKKQIPGCKMSFANEIERHDREYVLKSVVQHVKALDFVPKHFKSDKEVILAAVNLDGHNLSYASDELKNDFDVVKTAVIQSGQSLYHASLELKGNRDIVLAAVKQDGESLLSAENYLVEDKEIVLAAVKQGGYALRFAGESLRSDKEIVHAAVKQYSQALLYASEELRDDYDVVSCAVEKDGYALRLVSDRMANHKDIVMKAVTNYGKALKFASDGMKNDLDIVSTAVNQNGEAIEFVHPSLLERHYETLCISALSNNNKQTIQYIDSSLQSKLMTEIIQPQLKVHDEFMSFLLCCSFTWYKENKKNSHPLPNRRKVVKDKQQQQQDDDDDRLERISKQEPVDTPSSSSSVSSPSSMTSYVWLLNVHGKQNAGLFKHKISEYLGVVIGSDWSKICKAAEQLKIVSQFEEFKRSIS